MEKITIQTDCDFTPLGKRRARIVTLARGVRRIRWYVSGRRYRQLAVTDDNIAMSRDWISSVSTHPMPFGVNGD